MQLLGAQRLRRLGIRLQAARLRHLLPPLDLLRQARDDVGVLRGDVGVVQRILDEVVQLELGIAVVPRGVVNQLPAAVDNRERLGVERRRCAGTMAKR